MSLKTNRHILTYAFLFVLTIALGLLSRANVFSMPSFISAYAGDTLWALMVYFGLCIIINGGKTKHLLVIAIIFSFTIELSQLYHPVWLDDLRNTQLGGLVLGFGFKMTDLLCYITGVLFGAVIDTLIINKKHITRRLTHSHSSF